MANRFCLLILLVLSVYGERSCAEPTREKPMNTAVVKTDEVLKDIEEDLTSGEAVQAVGDGETPVTFAVNRKKILSEQSQKALSNALYGLGSLTDWRMGGEPVLQKINEVKDWVRKEVGLPQNIDVKLTPTGIDSSGVFTEIAVWISGLKGAISVGKIENLRKPSFSETVRQYDAQTGDLLKPEDAS